jgi:hypothetical protein
MRPSRTGFFVYLSSAPVHWMSKKQGSVESSTFGSEFCAMKHCCEFLGGLRYKLLMMVIACKKPAYIQGENQSVLYNTSNTRLDVEKEVAKHCVPLRERGIRSRRVEDLVCQYE